MNISEIIAVTIGGIFVIFALIAMACTAGLLFLAARRDKEEGQKNE